MTPGELWKRGIPLSEAWWEFSSEELYRKYNRPKLSRTINPKTGVGMLIGSLPDTPERESHVKRFIRMQHEIEFFHRRADVRRDMEMDVLEQLREGTLVAYGYYSGRNVKAPPVEIPERFYEQRFVKWHLDEISAPPDIFRSARVLAKPIPSSRRHAKLGRPRDHDDIIAAMQLMVDDDPKIVFKPRKTWVARIRQRMHELFPGKYPAARPADRTIMRIIPAGEQVIATTRK